MSVGFVDWMTTCLTCLEPAGVGVVCAGGATFLLCLELVGVGVVCAGGATFLLCLELVGVVAVWFFGWVFVCFLCLSLSRASWCSCSLSSWSERTPSPLSRASWCRCCVCRWCHLSFLSGTRHTCIKVIRICPYSWTSSIWSSLFLLDPFELQPSCFLQLAIFFFEEQA